MTRRQGLMALACTFLYSLPAHADHFSETIAYAYAHHPALKAEEENLNAVRDGVWEAYSGFMPSASANYDRGRKRFEFDSTDREYTDTLNKSIQITQPIFQGGGTIAQVRGAHALTKAEEARFYDTGQQVLFNAVAAYTRFVEATKLLEINRDNLNLLGRHMEATRTRRKAKDLTITDVALSEARLARAEADLRRSEGEYDSARAAYIREIGLEPSATELPLIPEGLPKDAEDAAAKAANHPALLAAQQQEKAADSAVYSRIATILPSVNVTGSMERREGISTVSTALSNIDEDSVTVRVAIPLYQSGAEYARLSQANHRYQKARNETTDTIRDTRENALRAWYDYNASAGAVAAQLRASDAAQRALDGIQQEYKYGARTVLDMLDTQQEQFSSRSGLIRAQAQQVINAYRLVAATGGLDPAMMKLNVSLEATANKPASAPVAAPVTAVEPVTLQPATPEAAPAPQAPAEKPPETPAGSV